MNQFELDNYPKIETGSSDFKDFRTKSDIIVDKSLLIKELLRAPSTLLITRPRR